MKRWKIIAAHGSSKLIVPRRGKIVIRICLPAISAILAGCAAHVPSPYPDVTSLLNAPPPQTRQELVQRCIYLRQEILLQRTKEDTALITVPNTTLIGDQQDAARNVAALKEKSANLGCDKLTNKQSQPATTPATSPTTSPATTPATTKDIGSYIDICMAKCKQYTSRTPEECFDSCK